MAQPLMPKATAVWLLDNTTLTFVQIAKFCSLHELEVQAIADGEVAIGMVGTDPVLQGLLTRAEIDRCQSDESATLVALESTLPEPVRRTKGPRYTPVARRGDKPDAIAWLLKNIPDLTDIQIAKLIGTTKPTINAVRTRTHENSVNIKPRSPVALEFCTQGELDTLLAKLHISSEGLHHSQYADQPEPEPEYGLS